MDKTTLTTLCLSLSFLGCAEQIDPDAEEALTLDEQLSNTYQSCQNEGIRDIETMERILNAGAAHLGEHCVAALGKVDFEAMESEFGLELTFETPRPDRELNPLSDPGSSWQNITGWSSANNSAFVSTGTETNAANNMRVIGIDDEGRTSPVYNFFVNDLSVEDIAINFTLDYSNSMSNENLAYINDYFKDLHSSLPEGIPTRVTVFSDTTNFRTNGFVTDYAEIQAALDFDQSLTRGGTALYDAWNFSLPGLHEENRPVTINIIATDGFENSSSSRSRHLLESLIADTNTFNIILASTWAEPDAMEKIIGDKGFIAYKYQISQAQTIVADIKSMLENMKLIQIDDELADYQAVRLENGNKERLLIPLN
jgi:uncharacterized protein (DUF2237 family)